MKIISYNVNGIRAAITKGFLDWLQQANPDVICLQEIKATEDQIPTEAITAAGYPYQYYFSAQKKGYSGVAILSKTEPKKVVFGTGIPEMDFEGRNLRADFDDFSVMSLYLPSGTNIERLDHKFKYMDDFQMYINELKAEPPQQISWQPLKENEFSKGSLEVYRNVQERKTPKVELTKEESYKAIQYFIGNNTDTYRL